MDSSILNDIKKMLGLEEDETHFDMDLIVHINTVLFTLYQLGLNADKFFISDSSGKWSDFLGSTSIYHLVKDYVYMKVRMMFDTPSGSTETAFNETIKELEWRLYVEKQNEEEETSDE